MSKVYQHSYAVWPRNAQGEIAAMAIEIANNKREAVERAQSRLKPWTVKPKDVEHSNHCYCK